MTTVCLKDVGERRRRVGAGRPPALSRTGEIAESLYKTNDEWLVGKTGYIEWQTRNRIAFPKDKRIHCEFRTIFWLRGTMGARPTPLRPS